MSTADFGNPFASAETWDVSTERWLQEGNYVVRITNAQDETSQNGRPKLRLELEASEGVHTDHIPYHSEFLRRVVGPFRAAGIQDPQPGEFDPNDECRLTEACRRRLIGKTVGVVIRNEADQNDPQKMWPRVAGYVDKARITGHQSDAGFDTRGLPDVSSPPPAGDGLLDVSPSLDPVADDALPF
jgi:hypothetical protein